MTFLLKAVGFIVKVGKGFVNFGKKLLTSIFVRKTTKGTVISIVAAILVFLFMAVWALFTVGMLIMDGEFDGLGGRKPGLSDEPGTQPIVTYDEITDLINQVDLEALRASGLTVAQMLGEDSNIYLKSDDTGMSAYTLLKLYLLLAEVCSNPTLDQSASPVKVKPYMMLGTLYHENKLNFKGINDTLNKTDDPYEMWTTMLAYTEFGSHEGNATFASLYGQTSITHGEVWSQYAKGSNGINYMTGPTIAIKNYPDYYSKSVLYISRQELASWNEAERLVHAVHRPTVIPSSPQLSDDIANKLVYKNHTLFPWAESYPQRPSGLFLPDATGTFGYNVNDTFLDSSVCRSVDDATGGTGILQEYGYFVGSIAIRAPHHWTYKGENPMMQQLSSIESTKGLNYLWSNAYILEQGGSAYQAYQNIELALYGAKCTGSGVSIGTPGLVPDDIRQLFNDNISLRISGEGPISEGPAGPLQFLVAGKMLYETTKAVAALAKNQFPRPDGGGTIGYAAGFGQNPMDWGTAGEKWDGICDQCGGSIFMPPVDGCTHTPSNKILFPVVGGWVWSDLTDYHTTIGCSHGYHASCSHSAYDISGCSDSDLIAIFDGELLMADSGDPKNYGYHGFLCYPNTSNPEVYLSYAHMNRDSSPYSVGVTSNVRIGDKIGTVGKTGNSDGKHLHWQITRTKNMVSTDSSNFMDPSDSEHWFLYGDKNREAWKDRKYLSDYIVCVTETPTTEAEKQALRNQLNPSGQGTNAAGGIGNSAGGSSEDWALILVNNANKVTQAYVDSITMITVTGGYKVDKRIENSLKSLLTASSEDGVTLIHKSSFRSIAYQQEIWDANVGNTERAIFWAEPGGSEHHLGLGIDFNSTDVSFENTKEFEWLNAHAHEYGFILRFPKDPSNPNGAHPVTKIAYEPWHWRYVGVAAATEIKNSGVIFENYSGAIKASVVMSGGGSGGSSGGSGGTGGSSQDKDRSAITTGLSGTPAAGYTLLVNGQDNWATYGRWGQTSGYSCWARTLDATSRYMNAVGYPPIVDWSVLYAAVNKGATLRVGQETALAKYPAAKSWLNNPITEDKVPAATVAGMIAELKTGRPISVSEWCGTTGHTGHNYLLVGYVAKGDSYEFKIIDSFKSAPLYVSADTLFKTGRVECSVYGNKCTLRPIIRSWGPYSSLTIEE